MRTVLALDPGHTTGYSIISLPDALYGKPIKPRTDMMQFVKDFGHLEFHHGIEDLIVKHKVDVIAFEAFKLYGNKASSKTGSSFETVQVIGIIKWLCHKHQIPWHNEMAVNVKKFYTDEKLKDHGIICKGKKHAKDSFRHLLYFLDFGVGKEGMYWYEK